MTRSRTVVGGVLVVLVSVIVGLLSFIVTNRFAQVADNTQQIKDTTAILRVVLAITSCTAEDTPAQCLDRTRATATAEGVRRIAEVDCVTRRAVAGLPAPIPPGTCISQTPAEVYPGKAP